ncbi:hypothetical protein [Streptomyces sp. NPDC057494]|uniref:hypothetical protein n=1 Tax=Streptomyces sp. NPDC057494 TaxID=3346148 RepID=UPI0036C60481
MGETHVRGFKAEGKWRYIATCPCGWHCQRWDADWEFIVTIATAHAWLKRGAR